MDKAVKISIIVGALIVALSVSYYLVLYIPKRDKAKIEQQAQQAEQQKQDKFRAECIEGKRLHDKQHNDLFKLCKTDLCMSNFLEDTSWKLPENWMELCISRKQQGLPTLGD